MRESRAASPMPDNVGYLRDTLPEGSRLILHNGNANQPFFYKVLNGIRRYGPKAIIGAGGLYGAYKLGQYHDVIANKFNKIKSSIVNAFNAPRSNYTRSGA